MKYKTTLPGYIVAVALHAAVFCAFYYGARGIVSAPQENETAKIEILRDSEPSQPGHVSAAFESPRNTPQKRMPPREADSLPARSNNNRQSDQVETPHFDSPGSSTGDQNDSSGEQSARTGSSHSGVSMPEGDASAGKGDRDTNPETPDKRRMTGDSPSVCGNGRIERGEECDDGNRKDGDGCSAACAIENERRAQKLLYDDYKQEVEAFLQKYFRYPEKARRKNLSGATLVDFEISRDGRVGNIEVAQSSGHKILDHEALETVRYPSRLPPPPANLLEYADPVPVRMKFNFVLNSSGVGD